MDQQFEKSLLRFDSRGNRFLLGGLSGNHNISQEFGCNILKCVGSHWKCNNIGGSFTIQIDPVQFSDTKIIYNQNGKLAIRGAQGV